MMNIPELRASFTKDDDVLPADTAKLHMLIKDLQHKLETAKDVGFTQMSILNQDLRDLEEEKVMACNIHDDTMTRLSTKYQEASLEHKSLQSSVEDALHQLMIGQQNLGELKRQIHSLSTIIQKRESKVWAFLFTEAPAASIPSTPTSPVASRRQSKTLDGEIGHLLTRISEESVDSFNLQSPPRVETEELQLTDELKASLLSVNFDMHNFSDNELQSMAVFMLLEIAKEAPEFDITEEKATSFVDDVSSKYPQNPFHSFRHAFSVTQMMYHLISAVPLTKDFLPWECLALMIASLAHDLNHPGVNNTYLINNSDPIAIRQNDISPLEFYHASQAFKPMMELLSSAEKPMKMRVRKLVNKCILSTDMAHHFDIINKFQEIVEDFSFEKESHRDLLLQVIIKSCDVSNEMRRMRDVRGAWSVAKPWADKLLTEFSEQTVKERRHGLPITEWMLPENVIQSKLQVNFLDHILIPMWSVLMSLYPSLDAHCERLVLSRGAWQEKYDKYLASLSQDFTQ